MEHYLTSTELKQNLKRAKELARAGIVHVLENGHEGYVLCSAQVYEEAMRAARAEAVWEAEVREVCREGLRDKADGKARLRQGVHVAQTAERDLTLEYDGRGLSELEHVLTRIGEDPEFGLAIELQGLSLGVRKVLVPPNDLIYCWDKSLEAVIVLGIVHSLGFGEERLGT